MQTGQQLSPSSSQYLSITTNKPPLRSGNVYQMLLFEWALFIYYVYLFTSVWETGHCQLRMLWYCLLFLLFDKLDLSYKYCQLQDPLHLSPGISCMRYLSYICIINISVLLVRIVIDNKNIHAFVVVMHFLLIFGLFLNQFSKRGMKLDINVDSNSIFSKFITPMSMFIFNRTIEGIDADMWYLQFVLFGVNLFISSELNRIMLMKECQYFGWMTYEEASKEKTTWNRRRALRTMIVVCSVMIVVQNLLFVFERVKYEASVTIVHTFIVSVLCYLFYVGYLPFRK